eukprot:gene14247-14395_t
MGSGCTLAPAVQPYASNVSELVAARGCGGVLLGGLLPERYAITTPAAHNGSACPELDGATRTVTACTNPSPCNPVACNGTWETAGPCQAACHTAELGRLPEVYMVYSDAVDGGNPCPVNNQTLRNSTTYSTLQQVYVVEQEAAHGGSPCASSANDTRTVTCHNPQMCPVNCTGSWLEVNGTCTATTCESIGIVTEEYIVSSPAMYNGSCEAVNGTTRSSTPCFNSNICPLPVDCEGHWMWDSCSTTDCTAAGHDILRYHITQAAMFDGRQCPAPEGKTRLGAACSIACPPAPQPPPRDCEGQYVEFGRCSALCGGDDIGHIPMMYLISVAPAAGGLQCTRTNGSISYYRCVNNNACPWDDVQLPDSPPVLPPLNMTLNDSDVHIKGGNVTISGVKIEGASGFSSGAASNNVSGSSSFNGSSASGNGSQALKPRICQFNGSLAFYTFGVVVDVLGEFQLQRGMSWTWNTTWKAWVAEVSIRGTFSFTREELVNNVSLGVQTLKPGVWGYLTLYSSVYPGPGFSGKYDWAGELELSPDPFQEWTDATSLLVANSTAPKHLTSGRRRALLQQSTTGLVPVQGRVAIKESKTVVDNSGSTSGVLALDDSGDIQLVCGGNCPDMGQPQLGAPDHSSGNPAATPGMSPNHSGLQTNVLTGTLIAAIAAAAGVGLCAVGIVGAVVYRRRKRKEEQLKKAALKSRRLSKPSPEADTIAVSGGVGMKQ